MATTAVRQRSRPMVMEVCLNHAPCMSDLQAYNPKICQSCSIHFETLLGHLYLTGLEPEYAAVYHRWNSFVKMCSKHKMLQESAHPEEPFSGFPE